MNKFKLNDTVQWTSQANGRSKTKTGRIIAIVPSYTSYRFSGVFRHLTHSFSRRPRDPETWTRQNFNVKFENSYRMHKSYLVEVECGPNCKSFLYHPLVSHLSLVNNVQCP